MKGFMERRTLGGGWGEVVNDFRQAKASYFFIPLTFVGWHNLIRNDQS